MKRKTIASTPELSIKSMTITQIYSLYRTKKLKVNRRYQRKLCWTIEEKRNFIDTISSGFPVPLFLFAVDEDGNYEIIDGMQRLDAICTLIDQKYSLKDGYFNLRTMPDTLDLLESGELNQKSKVLSPSVCKDIANYILPVSVFSLSDDNVEEVFKRINSTGRHLSKQELRQVGINSDFSNIVRELSQSIRGDYSDDILNLTEMSKISLSNHKLEYSININETFWIKNRIFPDFGLRQSRDEEVIALIIVNMLSDTEKYNFYSNILDKYYGYKRNPLDNEIPKEVNKVQTLIDRNGKTVVINQFDAVFSCIQEVIVHTKKNFRELLNIDKNISDIGMQFQMVFLTIYRLMFLEGKNEYDIVSLSKNLGSLEHLFKTKTTRTEINSVFKAIYGNIETSFSVSDKEDPAHENWTRHVVNIINKSRTEQSLYDFKLGLLNLYDKKYSPQVLEKIMQTLTAINNTGINKTGYVIMGIADEIKDAERCKEMFGVDYILENEFPIVGIDHEYKELNQSVDVYTKNVKEYIRVSESIDDDFKAHLIDNMKTPLLYGKQLILFKTNYNKPVLYKKEYFERNHTDIRKLNIEEYDRLFNKFYNTKGR